MMDCEFEGAGNRRPVNVVLAQDGRSVRIIDQTLLPGTYAEIDLTGAQECFDAIARLAVRGAPAIGIFAGMALCVLAHGIAEGETKSFAPGDNAVGSYSLATDGFLIRMAQVADYLKASRPTAVNLEWATSRMMARARDLLGVPIDSFLCEMRREAQSIQDEDLEKCLLISQFGLGLLEDGYGIITHCNAGPLATSGYGTSMGPVILGHERGMRFKVFVDETRPLLQGARLTAYELVGEGIDTTLICDGMSSNVMKQGWVQACLVGCDRVAANGDTANKIGTSNLAIVAKRYGVPFYVMCPTSTIDYSCATGVEIPIELRDGEEIKTKFFDRIVAPEQVKCYNPSFDVTDCDLIDAIVTERGICYPPFTESLAKLR